MNIRDLQDAWRSSRKSMLKAFVEYMRINGTVELEHQPIYRIDEERYSEPTLVVEFVERIECVDVPSGPGVKVTYNNGEFYEWIDILSMNEIHQLIQMIEKQETTN